MNHCISNKFYFFSKSQEFVALEAIHYVASGVNTVRQISHVSYPLTKCVALDFLSIL